MDKSHKNDDLHVQSVQDVHDYAARFPPGFWICDGTSAETTWKYDTWQTEKTNVNWDRTALQILQTCKESGHAVISLNCLTAVKDQTTVTQTRAVSPSKYFRGGEEISKMVCRLEQSANHADDLPEKRTPTVTKESSNVIDVSRTGGLSSCLNRRSFVDQRWASSPRSPGGPENNFILPNVGSRFLVWRKKTTQGNSTKHRFSVNLFQKN